MNRNRFRLVLVALTMLLLPTAAAFAGGKDDAAPPQASAAEGQFNLADVLQGSSGVRVATMCTNCNVANVTMLGQTGDRVQVWQDGLPVVGGLGAIYLLNVMPSDAIASTDIVRGPGTVLSGYQAGVGAVVMRTRSPLAQRQPFFKVSGDLGSLDWQGQKVIGTGRKGRLGGEFAVTHAESAFSDPNHDGAHELAAFDRLTYSGTLAYEIARRSHLRLDLTGYREDQRGSKGGFAEARPSRFFSEDIDIRRSEASVAWDYAFPDRSRLTVTARYTRRNQYTSDDSGIRLPTQPTNRPYYMIVNESARLAEARYERTLLTRHRLAVGGSFDRVEASGAIKHGINLLNPDSIAPQVIDDFIRHKGGFAEVEFSLPARFDLTAGVRWDALDWTPGVNSAPLLWQTIPHREKGKVLPRLRLAWKPAKVLALNLSGGDAMSAPRPSLERICCGAMAFSTGLTPFAETSRNVLLDVDYVPFRWWKIRASGFENRFDHYLQKLAVLAFDYTPSYLVANYSPFKLRGVEVSTEVRLKERFSVGAEASHLRVRSDGPITASADLALGGPTGNWSLTLPSGLIPNVPKNQSSAFVKWDDAETGLLASVQAQYTGPMKIQVMPRIGLVTDFAMTPGYWIVNLSARKRLGENFGVFGGIDNLTQKVQTHLDDPRYEYNWGPLRGRYAYAGLSWEM